MEEKEQFPWEEPTTTPQPHTPLPSQKKKKRSQKGKERKYCNNFGNQYRKLNCIIVCMSVCNQERERERESS
jgi:hypothetical protein